MIGSYNQLSREDQLQMLLVRLKKAEEKLMHLQKGADWEKAKANKDLLQHYLATASSCKQATFNNH